MSQPPLPRQPRHHRYLPPRSRQTLPTPRPGTSRHHRTQSSVSTAPPPSTSSENSSPIGDNGVFLGQSGTTCTESMIPHSTQTASSASSTSSFGHIAPSFYTPAQTRHSHRLLAQATRPRLAPVNPINYPLQSVSDTLSQSHQRYPASAPHVRGHTLPSYRSQHGYPLQPPNNNNTTTPTSFHSPHKSSSLPDLRNVRPHDPEVICERRLLEDSSTKPFPLCPPPYSDHDVPLPQPYNAAYPHPLTAYASPGVNSAAIKVVKWREALQELMEKDLDGVKGTILAASDRDINPPALMIPVYEGEGCGIPERLWSRFESIGEAQTTSLLSTSSTQVPSSIPPRFIQAGIQVVATPGGRPSSQHPDFFPLSSADTFPAVRTNFSNVLRRNSNDTDAGRSMIPGRRPVPQPTPFHKTELCRTWEHEGTCKYGSNCQFAHGFLELRMPVSSMTTPPNPYTNLPIHTHDPYISPTRRHSHDSPTPTLDRQATWRTARAPHLDFIGEMDSPRHFHRDLQPTETPAPIGAERAWKTVPIPAADVTEYRPVESTPYRRNDSLNSLNFDPPWFGDDFEKPSSAISIKASTSSLSASAASFHSTSPQSLGYSYSTSPTSIFLGSSYPDTHHSGGDHLYTPQTAYPAHLSPVIGHQNAEGDIPDWEVLKRSIDATTIRSVW